MAFNFPGGGLFGGSLGGGGFPGGSAPFDREVRKGGERSARRPGQVNLDFQNREQQQGFSGQLQDRFSQENEDALNAQLMQLLASLRGGGGFGGGLGGGNLGSLFGRGGFGSLFGGGGPGGGFIPGRTRTAPLNPQLPGSVTSLSPSLFSGGLF